MIAGIFVFALGDRAWYFYGASGEAERQRMPNYALQWAAMQWARSRGCKEYDLWGIPDEDEATLEAQYLERNDDLWGVYRFKRGFGGKVIRFAGRVRSGVRSGAVSGVQVVSQVAGRTEG